ncbi:MAG: hypothetical protein LBH92_02390 [Bacteroidales bacterium]|jgi:hypothetical protein|nr:hypothetical protein [Bacteroidales bacterium]
MIEELKKYIQLQLERLQLSSIEKTSLLLGKISLLAIVGAFLAILGLLILVLLYSVLLNIIGISWIVVLIEIGIVGLCLAIFWLFREKLVIRPIANMIIRLICEPSDDSNKKKEEKHEP